MASILNKDPASYAREKASFLRDLQHFHDTRGTPSRAPPRIDGKEIDLYLLYVLVTAQGGWVKVNQRNDWKNLLENFNLISSCVNAEVALKQIYLRYLDRYEKINFLGETGDIAGDDDEDSRHKKWSARALHSVPLVYNHHQHTVLEPVRLFHGLSTNLYKPSDYDKLSLSLLSPLPNEQDLAINVCILLSNENKHAIKLSKCPQILHHLLAHAGVFTHPASRKYWDDYYRKVRKWSIKSFWKEVLDEQELMYLTDENRFCARSPKTLPRKDDESSSCSDDDEDYNKNNKVKLNFDPSDDELFGLKRPLGTDDPYGQRVYQVALILRNLTFFEENMKVMGQDLTFLRFVLLCCATRWNCLHQIGFEMLGNIGPVVPLDVGSLQHATLDIVCKNITESNDRSIILSAVEALNRMGSNEASEDFLLKNINQKVYDKICNMLSLHDIMLLIQTLECLYSLSSLGERACNAIVHVHGVIDTLVSLITVEAQTYGPKACILMRVIETVTTPSTTSFTPEPAPKIHSMAAPSVPPPSSASQHLISSFTSQNVLPLPTPAVANPVILPNPPSAVPVMSTTLNTFTSVAPTVSPPVPSVASPKMMVPVTMTVTANSTMVSTTNQPTQSVVVPQAPNLIQQENEQFALTWIRATLEVCPTPGRGIDQAELYKLYMTACARAGRRGVIAPLHFPRCVKAVFGPSVGPKTVKLAQSHGGLAMDPPTQIIAYEGIQVRSKPLPIPISAPMVVTQSTSVIASSIPTSPILKAKLSAPATNTQQNSPLIKREILGKTIQQSPASSTSVSTETSVVTTVATTTIPQSEGTLLSNSNTSLIKTLLASKVCDPKLTSATIKLSNNESCTLYASSQNCNSTVINEVTQRQQQQKILQQQNNSTSTIAAATSAVILPKQTVRINGIRPTSTDEICKNDIGITMVKSEPQQSVITTISSSNKILANSLNIQNDNDQNEMTLTEPKKEPLLNGTPEVSDINDMNSKSLMLSGLLDKEIEKKDAPFLFGSIQVGDNGLELNGACLDPKEKSSGTCVKMLKEEIKDEIVDESEKQLVKVIVGGKRTSEEGVPCDQAAKKPHINGNSSSNDDENMEIDESNMKASSTAANLYAALAADVLEDEDEPPKTPAPPPPQHHIKVNTQHTQQIFQSPGQIIVSSSNNQWASNNQRGIVTMVHQGSAGGPQQYVLTQPQSALVQGQGQTVLLAQTPQGSGGKTIIILQQPAGNNQSPNTMTLSQTNFVQSSAPGNQSKVIVQRIPTPPTIKQTATVVTRPVTPVTSNAIKQQQVKTVIKTVPHIVSAPMPTPPPPVQSRIRPTAPIKVTGGEVQTIPNQGQFLCEWRGCMRNFKSANEVYMHACESHCPSNGVQEMQCLWERCDSMKRKRFSLMTHLFDRHCNPDVLRMMAVRRKQLSQSGRSEIPAPAPPTPHPGYAPNAAFNAIKRHALEFVNPKELQDDNEGPVTKSIRLTSALILRNLVIYSSTGRWHLKRYEAHLSNIALSNVESSRTISQLLFDLCHSS